MLKILGQVVIAGPVGAGVVLKTMANVFSSHNSVTHKIH